MSQNSITLQSHQNHKSDSIGNLMHTIAIYFIGASMVVTFLLELWTGCAIAGWAGDKSIVQRSKSPGPYWFVMVLQATILVFAFVIASSSWGTDPMTR